MRLGDPRFASYPAESGPDQLRWYIAQTAQGALSIQDLLADFRRVHEAIEQNGPAEYDSSDEARAIWDVLWAVEFCTDDPAKSKNPSDWYAPADVLAIVQRAAEQLKG